jgi:hypothetical protein
MTLRALALVFAVSGALTSSLNAQWFSEPFKLKTKPLTDGEKFGSSIDVYADWAIVGSAGPTPKAHVYQRLGPSGAFVLQADLTIPEYASLLGEPIASDHFGSSATPIADLNGDGVTDLVVGAPGDDQAGEDAGAVLVLLLTSEGLIIQAQRITTGSAGFPAMLAAGDRFGSAVADVGDLNGDGTHDLAVGATGDDSLGADSGAVWIVYLNPDGSVADAGRLPPLESGAGVEPDDSDRFGSAIAPIGDFNGDGVPDIAVGASGDEDNSAGAVHLVCLEENGGVASNSKIGHESSGLLIDQGAGFGSAIATLESAEGFVRLAVGAPSFQFLVSPDTVGDVYVLAIDANGVANTEAVLHSPSFIGSDRFGIALAPAPQLAADGSMAFLVSESPWFTHDGIVWLAKFDDGAGWSLDPLYSEADVLGDTDDVATHFGSSLGILESPVTQETLVFVGNSLADIGESEDSGELWLIKAGEDNPLQTVQIAASGSQQYQAPSDVDVNDHTSLFTIGVPSSSAGEGAVYTFRRSGDNIVLEHVFTSPSEAPSPSFGTAVSSVGQNRLLIGAPHEGTAGRVYYYEADLDTFDWSAHTTVDGAEAGFSTGANFGAALDSHFTNWITGGVGVFAVVGAPFHDGTQEATGAVGILEWPGNSSPLHVSSVISPHYVSSSHLRFGQTVSLDHRTATFIAGAPGHKFGQGAALIYERTPGPLGNTWTQEAVLLPEGLVTLKGFGTSVALDERRALVGAPDAGFGNDRGWVFAYRQAGAEWQPITALSHSSSEDFGKSLGLFSAQLLVGDPSADPSGAAYSIPASNFQEIGDEMPDAGLDGVLALDQDWLAARTALDGGGFEYVLYRCIDDPGGTTWRERFRIGGNSDFSPDVSLHKPFLAFAETDLATMTSVIHIWKHRSGTDVWEPMQTLSAADTGVEQFEAGASCTALSIRDGLILSKWNRADETALAVHAMAPSTSWSLDHVIGPNELLDETGGISVDDATLAYGRTGPGPNTVHVWEKGPEGWELTGVLPGASGQSHQTKEYGKDVNTDGGLIAASPGITNAGVGLSPGVVVFRRESEEAATWVPLANGELLGPPGDIVPFNWNLLDLEASLTESAIFLAGGESSSASGSRSGIYSVAKDGQVSRALFDETMSDLATQGTRIWAAGHAGLSIAGSSLDFSQVSTEPADAVCALPGDQAATSYFDCESATLTVQRVTQLGATHEILTEAGFGSSPCLVDCGPDDVLASDAAGNVFVRCDVSGNIFRIAPDDSIEELFEVASLEAPAELLRHVADQAGGLYVLVADAVYHVAHDGELMLLLDAEGVSGQPFKTSTVDWARDDIITAPNGTVYVTAADSNAVFEISPGGVATAVLTKSGDGFEKLKNPTDLALNADGLLVATSQFSGGWQFASLLQQRDQRWQHAGGVAGTPVYDHALRGLVMAIAGPSNNNEPLLEVYHHNEFASELEQNWWNGPFSLHVLLHFYDELGVAPADLYGHPISGDVAVSHGWVATGWPEAQAVFLQPGMEHSGPWLNLGFELGPVVPGLPNFVAPGIHGKGAFLCGGGPISITLDNPLAGFGFDADAAIPPPAYLVVGFTPLYAPLLGGTLVPTPDVVIPLELDSVGQLTYSFHIPAGFTEGSSAYLQVWVANSSGPLGYTASNALQIIAQ